MFQIFLTCCGAVSLLPVDRCLTHYMTICVGVPRPRGLTLDPLMPSTNVYEFAEIHLITENISTVVPVMNGHPRDQAKVSVHCR